MQTTRIAILGGGLSGLYAAFLLEQNGFHDYVLLEARDAPGGRIASLPAAISRNDIAAAGVDRFDLGATWFWPDLQPELDRLVRALGLHRFEQFEAGDMMVERSSHEPPARMRGYGSSPASMRLVGGMATLIDALRSRLNAARIITGQAVRHLRATDTHIELDSLDATGRITAWRAEHVLLAMPPRLAMDSIEFMPALPDGLARHWRATPTWMAPHAKYVAVYDTPFWRERGLSGEARSGHGPLGEIHDASSPDGSAALFGFFAVPARIRKSVPEDVMGKHCRTQLVRLFGPQAIAPKADAIKDWALDPYTAVSADMDGGGHHAEAPIATVASGAWRGRLTGIASEWSRQFPGYLAGAIDAANQGVQALSAIVAQQNEFSAASTLRTQS